MSIEEIVKYRCVDGSEWDSKTQAERHNDDMLCTKIESFLIDYFPNATRPSVYKCVKSLSEDKEMARKRLKEILDIID